MKLSKNANKFNKIRAFKKPATSNRVKRGFTLIELVVVIAIIGVLAGVLLIAINPAALVAKGRDAKRMEDLELLNKAIALALADGEMTLNGTPTVPVTGTSASGNQASDGTGWIPYTVPTGKTGLGKFIPALPLDPTNTDPYFYTFGSDGTYYELNAVLESSDNFTRMTVDGGNANTAPDARYEIGSRLDIL